MFEEILNIPAHPLIVHAAVVFVPLQIAIAFAYALVPFVRRYTAWAVLGLAVAAPAAAWAAKKSGEALKNRLIDRGLTSDQILTRIDQHNGYGDVVAWSSLVLGLLMLGLVAMLTRNGRGSGSADSDVAAGGGMGRRGYRRGRGRERRHGPRVGAHRLDPGCGRCDRVLHLQGRRQRGSHGVAGHLSLVAIQPRLLEENAAADRAHQDHHDRGGDDGDALGERPGPSLVLVEALVIL